MAAFQNPFKPTLGKTPPELLGRQSVVDSFAVGLDNGAGAPGRVMLLSGQRGYGKTVMLTELMGQAKARGWQVYLESAADGLCDRLAAQVAGDRPRLTSVDIAPSLSVGGALSASVGSASAEVSPARSRTLREALSALLASRRVKPGAGVLVCVDETQSASQGDLRELAVTYQQLVQEQDLTGLPDDRQKGVAVVMAGLPQTVDALVTADLTSFLARAQHHVLGEVPVDEVALSYVETVGACGMAVAPEVALEAARATFGYPYLIQLMGFHMVQAARTRGSDTVGAADVEAALPLAKAGFGDAVLALLWRPLPAPDRRFLMAMAEDGDRGSSVVEIAERCGKGRSWGQKRRRSLVDAGLIASEDRGRVAFCTPYMADWISSVPESRLLSI
jgi:hypothetical protein